MRVSRWNFVGALAAILMAPGQMAEGRAPQAPSSAPAATFDVRAVLDRYCVTCHNPRLTAGQLTLDAAAVDVNDVAGHVQVLEKVVRKLALGAMPPAGSPRPDPAAYTALTAWLEHALDAAAATHRNPGPSERMHRLNRAEYQNAIRDLLGIESADIAMLLPIDDASYGFDNIAGILGMTPTHLDKYLVAARKISRLAVGDVTLPPVGETHRIPDDLSQDIHLDSLPLGTRGGTRLHHYFPLDAEYVMRFQSVPGVGTAFKELNHIEVTVDGRRVFMSPVEQRPPQMTTSDDRIATTDYEVRVPVKAGPHDVTVAYLQTTSAEVEDLLQPFQRPPLGAFRLSRVGGFAGPYISMVSLTGPFNPTGPGDTESRRRIFTCNPAGESQELGCAKTILSRLARRAFRRSVTSADVDRFLPFYAEGRTRAGFDAGIQAALERMLASPQFLFRVYRAPARAAAGQPYRIDDVELASRLSFFLWSSIPDDELLEVAIRGTLHDAPELERQVRRMLADQRSRAIVDNFAGQWLRLRNLKGVVPDAKLFPDFDDNLRSSFRRETELFFDSIIREDRSIVDLLSANYTFLNERLARHYGIPNVYGSHFRRVALDDPRRGGLFGHGSILTVTSYADRTSPVGRGKWILENLIGAPPPPPPPDVPLLEATELKGTLRQRMEQHRKNPACASCHKQMDPLGFALENFDAVGAWRTLDSGVAVDAMGTLPDGTMFKGMAGLRKALLARPGVFVTTFVERLMTYAVGRGIEYYDAPTVRAIVRDAARSDYRVSALVLGIVKSVPFQMRLSPEATPAGTSAARD